MVNLKASTNREVSVREIENLKTVRKLAPQCMVLLENDGILPLKNKGKVALFGAGARRTIKGGTGSGDVNERSVVSVEQGFINAGFEVTSKVWIDEYNEIMNAAQKKYYQMLKEVVEKEGIHPIMAFFTLPLYISLHSSDKRRSGKVC